MVVLPDAGGPRIHILIGLKINLKEKGHF